MLTSRRFFAEMRSLRFTRLDGSKLELDELADRLKENRAVAFLTKGVAIHPAIASALHPDTIVATRVSYPSDPILIPLPETR